MAYFAVGGIRLSSDVKAFKPQRPPTHSVKGVFWGANALGYRNCTKCAAPPHRIEIPKSALYHYGRSIAKIEFEFLRTLEGKPEGRLILVTAISWPCKSRAAHPFLAKFACLLALGPSLLSAETL